MGEGGQGLILTISAKGFNANVDHEVKSQFNFHKDDATLQVFLDDSVRRAGLQGITIDPAFAGIVRDYQAAAEISTVAREGREPSRWCGAARLSRTRNGYDMHPGTLSDFSPRLRWRCPE